MYKWITFKELRGLPKRKFAEELAKCCLAVWVDDQAGFGTFPLEAMECNTPVIGKMPNLIPEWMETKDGDGNIMIKNNGVWTNTTLNIPELIATYLKVWLEDAVPSELMESIKDSQGKYTSEKQEEILKNVYENIFSLKVEELKTILENLEDKQNEVLENKN